MSNADPRILYCDPDRIVTVNLSSYLQHTSAVRRGNHCFDSVLKQVSNDLLKLSPMAVKGNYLK